MATSFITKNDLDGFWIHDSLFQVFCHLLSSFIESQKNETLSSLKEHLVDNSKGIFPGFMHIDFKYYLDNYEKELIFLELLELFINKLNQGPRYFTVEELNAFRVNNKLQGEWISKLDKSILVKIALSIKLLVKGQFSGIKNDPYFENHKLI